MVILGVLATGVVLVLPDPAIEQRKASLHAWVAQAESAALRSSAEARPWGWEIGQSGARLLVRQAEQWVPAPDRDPVALPLAAGLVVEALEIEGQRHPIGSRIVFSGTPPLFVLQIAGKDARWTISGLPNGQIALEALR